MKKLLALCLMLNIFMIGFTACSGGGSTGDTVANTAALPRISPQGGTYHGAIDITIFTSTGNAVIRYTTDGTEPTESNGSVYSGPVRVTGIPRSGQSPVQKGLSVPLSLRLISQYSSRSRSVLKLRGLARLPACTPRPRPLP
jgi:hypothetical protein